MIGGEDDAVGRARPLLEAMGKNLFHAGAAGAGQAAKICNNMLLGILTVSTFVWCVAPARTRPTHGGRACSLLRRGSRTC